MAIGGGSVTRPARGASAVAYPGAPQRDDRPVAGYHALPDHESLSVTVRLNTARPGAWSVRSATK